MSKTALRVGLDIGSTTVKLAVTDEAGALVFSAYERHRAALAQTACKLLRQAGEELGDVEVRTCVCGSGGKPVAEALGLSYVQEVVANSRAVTALYPQASCAIELGGQDAKIVFFDHDPQSGAPRVSDMRMNGSCAGGTGAFIDEIAKLLDVPVETLAELAGSGRARYDISGRCGVFAKTDIQPLLSQGASKADIALSSLHAIAKQVIGGLAQGLELKAPIVFEGGPLAYNPVLVDVFAEHLGLTGGQVIVPAHPEVTVAYGAALAAGDLASGQTPKTLLQLAGDLEVSRGAHGEGGGSARPLFESQDDLDAFVKRCKGARGRAPHVPAGKAVRGYVGLDCGSTTTKVAVVDEEGSLLASFYTHNDGDALGAVKEGLSHVLDSFAAVGSTLAVAGLCTTGYGEEMLARVLGADTHVVETTAHARASLFFDPEVSFVLDIGGQDMKALFVRDGVVNEVIVNEACSSGCGSFLETLAGSLGVPVDCIAQEAFSSQAPASLGSRCTVFMTSTVITAQRDGATRADILAGLCRSVIENVFTKVVRVHDMSQLGGHVMVQGGTFENLAVVRAMEEKVGTEVALAPYPGLMGAIGAALCARERAEGADSVRSSSFIGFEALSQLDCLGHESLACNGCANLCKLNVTRFSSGAVWVTGNRCSRGERILTDKTDSTVAAANLFEERERLVLACYDYHLVRERLAETVGIPRVLEFWESMPFWSTFFRALGYRVAISEPSSQSLYESGLRYVASDTACLPAKLAHGHIRSLTERGVDRIFFPHIMHMPPEGTDQSSPYMCSLVMGYPTLVANTQDPSAQGGPVYDAPVFHWFCDEDKRRQVCAYAIRELGATHAQAGEAFEQAQRALSDFKAKLRQRGSEVRRQVASEGGRAVVLAGRPYHTDPFLSHSASQIIASCGVPVLTVDSLEGLEEVELSGARAEITNNFHTRMLAAAAIAAGDAQLEYVQLVSFGCGHDAILTDEIARILKLVGDKHPLVLKLDESDASGSLKIRIRSFLETTHCIGSGDVGVESPVSPRDITLPDPFPVKFTKHDKASRKLIIPNISEEVSILLKGILDAEGFDTQIVEVGSAEQARLGKRLTHNDICFPCQMVIGELVDALRRGGWEHRQDEVAVGMVKFQCDCRMSHYAALLRMALDNAGFDRVPILTTDAVDPKGAHPGISLLGPRAVARAVRCFTMLDLLAQIERRQAPYEQEAGRTREVYLDCVRAMADAVLYGNHAVEIAYEKGVQALARVPLRSIARKPRVLVTGELLVTYHPGSNFNIEGYLQECGMEPMFPRFTDQLRKDFLAAMAEVDDFGAKLGHGNHLVSLLFDVFQRRAEKIARQHPLYEREPSPAAMYEGVRDIIPKTLSCGEGWLMAAEIDHYASCGVRCFVILQPFGCLPNHVCGRGVTKKLKERHPGIQILPLDLDPDTSRANIENRLQMLVMQGAGAGAGSADEEGE